MIIRLLKHLIEHVLIMGTGIGIGGFDRPGYKNDIDLSIDCCLYSLRLKVLDNILDSECKHLQERPILDRHLTFQIQF